jgi:uncharacterized membrane protein YgcG
METGTQQTDTRREQLRHQAIQRRQAVLDRIAGVRVFVGGGVVAIIVVLAGYLDANARPRTTPGVNAAASGMVYGGGSSQGVIGGGSPPSASSGGGIAVSGGS